MVPLLFFIKTSVVNFPFPSFQCQDSLLFCCRTTQIKIFQKRIKPNKQASILNDAVYNLIKRSKVNAKLSTSASTLREIKEKAAYEIERLVVQQRAPNSISDPSIHPSILFTGVFHDQGGELKVLPEVIGALVCVFVDLHTSLQ